MNIQVKNEGSVAAVAKALETLSNAVEELNKAGGDCSVTIDPHATLNVVVNGKIESFEMTFQSICAAAACVDLELEDFNEEKESLIDQSFNNDEVLVDEDPQYEYEDEDYEDYRED